MRSNVVGELLNSKKSAPLLRMLHAQVGILHPAPTPSKDEIWAEFKAENGLK